MVCILNVEFEKSLSASSRPPPADHSGAVSSRHAVHSFNLEGCGDKVDNTLTKSPLNWNLGN